MNLILVAVIAVFVGSLVLLAMVRYDLAPIGGLARGRQWLLATALGTGILAFALKLLIILSVSRFPEVVIDPLIEKPAIKPGAGKHDPLLGLLGSKRFVWQPLPVSQSDARDRSIQSDAGSVYVWQALPGQAPTPVDNPLTEAKIRLGERLFFDPRLSLDGSLSCSSCHDVLSGSGDDGRATSLGIGGQTGSRNAPTVWNAAFQSVLFWDGRARSLEEQALGPLLNPLEMGMPSLDLVVERVRQDPDYPAQFAQAFGEDEGINAARLAQAIASYERTLITPDTPYDRFLRGDLQALDSQQLRGMALFQSIGCTNCHFGPNFSGASLFDDRAPMRIFPIYPTPYEARYRLTRDSGAASADSGRGSWRVPSLRNVALTGPWLHNGSVNDLAEVVRIMSSVQLGMTGPYLVWADDLKVMTRLDGPALSDDKVADLVAFLRALSSDTLQSRISQARIRAEEQGMAGSKLSESTTTESTPRGG
ncbi:MAG: cytochrome c peroxidase [Candidatus Thiodiazotropha sp.]